MGRRSKQDILENPQEHDFELRPLHILPTGCEAEATAVINDVLKNFNTDNGNVVLELFTDHEGLTYYRYSAEWTLPPTRDFLDRIVSEGQRAEIRIQTSCQTQPDMPARAMLFAEADDHTLVFNNWSEIEVEYKGTDDPRRRRLLKYP